MLPVLIPFGSEDDPRGFSGDVFPWTNWVLIGMNVLIFLVTYVQHDFRWIVEQYGARPDEFRYISLITLMFLHSSPGHLVGNMLFLYAFGRLMNRRLGNVYYPVAYFLSGVIGTIVYVVFHLESSVPVIGASGAISGVMGLFISVAPWTNLNVWYFWWLLYRAEMGSFSVPSIWGIGVWLLFQLMLFLIESSSVAVMAHLGGFATGALLGLLFQFDLLAEQGDSEGPSGGVEIVERVPDEELEHTDDGGGSELKHP